MTGRDYRLIADTIASLAASTDRSGVEHVAQHFAAALAKTNPRFDYARFVRAAEGNPKAGDKPRTTDYKR